MSAMPKFEEQYVRALQDYLQGGGEADLKRAYELGRQAIDNQLSLLDVASAHQVALTAIVAGQLTPAECTHAIQQASVFFSESLASFEMAQRGFQETLSKLQTLNVTLEQRVAEQTQALLTANQVLRESESLYRTLVETSPDAITLTDLQGNYLFANQQAAHLYGFERVEELQSHNASAHIAPEDIPRAIENAKKVFEMGGLQSIEYTLLKHNGTRFPVELNAALVRDAVGNPRAFIGVIRDITERKRAEQAQRLLAEVGQLLAASLDYTVTLTSLAQLLTPPLADWCAIDMVAEETDQPRPFVVAHVDPSKVEWASELRRRYPPNHATSGVSRVLRTGQSEMYPTISDAMIEAAVQDVDQLQLLRELGPRSAMIVPLVARGRTLGAITFVQAESGRHYEPADLALAEELARRAALAVDNARLYRKAQIALKEVQKLNAQLEQRVRERTAALEVANQELKNEITERIQAEAALRESEEHFRLLVEGVEDYAIFRLDLKGQVAGWNTGAKHITGYRAEEIVGQPLSIFHPKEEVERGKPARLLKTAASVGWVEDEGWRVRKDGTPFWANAVITAVFDKKDRLLGFAKVIRDMTEHKQAAEEIQRQSARAHALVHSAARLNAQVELHGVIQAVCEETAQALNVPVASVSLCDAKRQVLYYAGGIGLPAEYEQHLQPLALAVYEVHAQRAGPVIVTPDVQALPELPNADFYLRLNLRTTVNASMLREGQLIGRLNIGTLGQPRHFTEDELALLRGLADQAAQAITNAYLYEAVQKELVVRKQAEEKIRESERSLAEAQQIAHLGSWRWEIATNQVAWSDELYRIYGLKPQEFGVTYEAFLERIYPDDREYVQTIIARALENRQSFTFDHRITRPDQTVRTLHAQGKVILDPLGNPVRMVGAGQDITERKQIEERLRQSREQLRALSAHLQSVREQERTRIAREIHDELGQALTGMKMDATWLQNNFGENLKAVAKTKSMIQLIDTTVQAVRRISAELRPGILDDLGLEAAIEWQLQEFQARTGIQSDLTSTVEEINLEADCATAIFRIFQEALTNVARHAQATQLEVTLQDQANHLILRVRDNGRGITEDELLNSRSFGLLGMQERVLLLAGEINIHGTPGKGTTLIVKVPLR